jgi:hypothetical protein
LNVQVIEVREESVHDSDLGETETLNWLVLREIINVQLLVAWSSGNIVAKVKYRLNIVETVLIAVCSIVNALW